MASVHPEIKKGGTASAQQKQQSPPNRSKCPFRVCFWFFLHRFLTRKEEKKKPKLVEKRLSLPRCNRRAAFACSVD